MAKRKKRTYSKRIESNILRVYLQATEEEREQGLFWYSTTHSDVRALADKHAITVSQCAGVVAALSPGLAWGLNLIQASELIAAFKKGAKLPLVGVYGHRNIAKCRRILNGELVIDVLPETGPKTRAFYHCINDPLTAESVTVDRHAKCLAFYRTQDREKFSVVRAGPEYAWLALHYRTLAGKLGILPHQLQAITWLAWKRIVSEEVPF